jgi:hypothetical protein
MTRPRPFTSRSHLADMSLPPQQRGRKNKTSRGKTKGVTAQLGHANGQPHVNDQRRKWDKHTRHRRR